MIEPKDKKISYNEMIYVYRLGSLGLNIIRVETFKNISWILWIRWIRLGVHLGCKREFGGGEGIILCLSYGQVV